MSHVDQLETHVLALEKQVAELRHSIESDTKKNKGLEGFIGLFKDYPDFGEIVKLGQEYRRSQRFETHG